MNTISRKEAKYLNLKRYFTGKKCKHNHLSERFVRNGECVKCKQNEKNKWIENNRERVNKIAKYYYKNNRKIILTREKQKRLTNPIFYWYNSLKRSANKRGIVFNLKQSDLYIPTTCPVLGIPIYLDKPGSDNSPSVDRIDNNKGYEKENIIIVSRRVNSIKRDATLKELNLISKFYSNLPKK